MPKNLDFCDPVQSERSLHLAGSRKADGDRVIANEVDRNVGLGFDRVAIHLWRRISPMPHSLHRCEGESAIPAEDINFGYAAVQPNDCSQADSAAEARVGRLRIAESALGWLRNLQTRS
jgi:hypothetical protein